MNEQILFYFIIGVVILLIIGFVISVFNKIIFLKNNIEKSFTNIDLVLKQRADEIPNLIAVVKESKNYEAKTLEQLTKLRAKYYNAASADEKVNITNQLDKSLKSAENYPILRANNNFMAF